MNPAAIPRKEPGARTAESQLRELVDHTLAAMFVKDLDGRFLFVNREFERIRGLPVGAILGQLDSDMFPASADEIRRNDRRVLDERRAIDFEEHIETSQGRRVYLAHKFPLLDASGRPYAVCGVATDITDRKRSEEALRAAALAVSSAEGQGVFGELARYLAEILDIDVAMIAVYADAERQRMRALATWLNGRLLKPFEYALAGSPCRHVVGRAFRFVGEGVRREFPPGTLFATHGMDSYAALPLNDSSGQPLGLIAAMDRQPMRDPSLAEAMLKIFAVRVVAEIERARADAALRASEASYRSIFEASEDALFVHDWDSGAILDANPKACATYGFTAEEFRHLDVAEVSAGVPPYTAADARRWIEKAKRDGSAFFEWHRRNRDGSLHWDEVVLKATEIAGTRRILACTREITERKLAEDALRASEEQYRAIFNASADALVLWNSRKERVDVNPAYERMFGYSREEVLRGDRARQVPADYMKRREEILARSFAGEACREEFESVRRNGEYFQAEVRTILIQHRGEPHVLAMIRDVTEARRAEQVIRASEQQYRAIFDASVDGLLLCDPEQRIVDANASFLEMHGLRHEDVVGRTDAFFLHDAPRVPWTSLLAQGIAGATWRAEARTRREGGGGYHVEIHGTPMQYQGRAHVLVTLRNVTARREAEERLRSSEKRYRLLFEMESDAILVTDAETLDLLDANRAAEELWGYTRDELLHMKATDLSAEKESTRKALQGADGTIAVPMRLHRKKDGTLFPVEITLNRFVLEGRKIVLSAIRDITERRQREEALARSEGRLRATVEAAFDCVIGMDGEGHLIEFNQAAERVFGMKRNDVLGRPFGELFIPPSMRAAHMEGLARFRRTGEGPFLGRRIETTALRADGSEFPVELAVGVAHAGESNLFVGYLRDIGDRKEAERRRTELEAQLRQAQKMEAIGHLTGGIAHDFNNLLTSIMGYVTLAEERAGGTDAKLGTYLGQAGASCRRARDLIQQMLTFSRGGRGEPRALALAPLIRESVKLLRGSFPATVALNTDLDDDAPPVMLDPVQLDQVLMNLAINARDAMSSHGEIAISVRRFPRTEGVCAGCRKRFEGHWVELAVADNGPGIAPDVQERMFDPFFTTKDAGHGSGMGLSTVHGIVHEHRGHIVVETAPGKGATFRVLLPALDAGSGPLARAPVSGGTGHVAGVTLRGRVAVVDDEASVAQYMRDLLAHWGLEVTTFPDAASALAAMTDGAPFDVVITDQTMPGMSGLELARELRSLRPALPVVLYTGYSAEMNREELERGDVVAVVRKPIEPAALLDALRRSLASSAPFG